MKSHSSTIELADLLAGAKTVRDDYSRLRQEIDRDRLATRDRPPLGSPPKTALTDSSALSEFFDSWDRSNLLERDLSRVKRKLLNLVPRIRRVLIYRSAVPPHDRASLDAFNQLGLATATGETLKHDPDDALLDLAVTIDLLQLCQDTTSRHRVSKSQAQSPRRNRPTLGKELLAARERAGHSQREAAEKIGCDHKDVSEWETGKRKPHPRNRKEIRDYIDRFSDPNKCDATKTPPAFTNGAPK